MIRINENDYGLNTLAGNALNYLGEQQLPVDLYVYGLRDGRAFDVYVDPELPNALKVNQFFNERVGVNSTVALASEPRIRPSLGLARRMRAEENIELSTRLAVFALMAANNRLVMSLAGWVPQANDLVNVRNVAGLYALISYDPVASVILNVLTGRRILARNADISPCFPSEVGQRVRCMVNSPSYDNGAGRAEELTTATIGVVTELGRGYEMFRSDAGHQVYVDPRQLIRIAN